MAFVVTKRARVRSSSAALPTAPHPCTPEPSSLYSLSDELIVDILLCASYESLTKAVLASKRCLRIACSGQFRRQFHERHPEGYPLLGLFTYFEDRGPTAFPGFYYANSLGNDSHGRKLVTSCDFQLDHPGRANWRIHDCFNCLLLLTRSTGSSSNFNRCITVCNPVCRNSVSVSDPPIGRGKLHSLFLLPSTDSITRSEVAFAFRLAGFQPNKVLIRLVVYDSNSQEWSFKSWVQMDMPPENGNRHYYPRMHASGHVYQKYREDAVLRVDAESMELSITSLPSFADGQLPWCIGGTEDQQLCLVHLVRTTAKDELHVRIYNAENICWVLQIQTSLSSIIGTWKKLSHIDAVVDGLVVLCTEGTPARRHLAFHLTTMKVLEEFDCRGVAFPYILPWLCFHKGETCIVHHDEQCSAQCATGVAGLCGHAQVSGLTAGQPLSVIEETDIQIPDEVIPTWEAATEPHGAVAALMHVDGCLPTGVVEVSRQGAAQLLAQVAEAEQIHSDGLAPTGGDVHRQGYRASHARVSSQCATATHAEETAPQMLADGAGVLSKEASQVVARGDGQIPTETGNEIVTGHQSTLGTAAQTQGSTSHHMSQDTCFACKGNHTLLNCDVKRSLVTHSSFCGQATTHPFWDFSPSIGAVPHLAGIRMLSVWFRVFGVPDTTRSWPELFQFASPVGRLEDVDLSTIDSSNSDYIRMLIHLVTIDGAPFSASISGGPIYVQLRFELDENQG